MMTTNLALELTSQIHQGDESRVEPLIKLIAGMCDARGDPYLVALRKEVLRNLYSRTKDSDLHLSIFVGDQQDDGVIPATSSAS